MLCCSFMTGTTNEIATACSEGSRGNDSGSTVRFDDTCVCCIHYDLHCLTALGGKGLAPGRFAARKDFGETAGFAACGCKSRSLTKAIAAEGGCRKLRTGLTSDCRQL